jgi:hypothetical protein
MATLTSWNGESDRDDIDPMIWESMDCARDAHRDCHLSECECDCHEEPDHETR